MLEWFNELDSPAQAAVVSAVVSAAVTLVLAFANPFWQRNLERTKAELQKDVEETKAQIAESLSNANARTSYEFEARKRLYEEIEPLFFQLFEAAEASYFRVASLARTARQGRLGGEVGSWLSKDGYYLRSTIYNIFLPLCIFRLIRNSSTFIDLRLDDNVKNRYLLLKISYYALTDDFELSGISPKIEYTPNVKNWKSLRETGPSRYWRQGLVIGHLDRVIDALSVQDGDSRRPMNYGEFERKYATDKPFQVEMNAAKDLFLGFDFVERPVLARVLFAHAYTMRLLLLSYSREVNVESLQAALNQFKNSPEAQRDLELAEGQYAELSELASGYLTKRLARMALGNYEIR